jgi:hypothetical protein
LKFGFLAVIAVNDISPNFIITKLILLVFRAEDIGGGAAIDLSRITLRWMVRQVISSQCGIIFDDAALIRASIPVRTFPSASPIKANSEELVLDGMDALQPTHDEIKKDPLWWLLEIIPLHYSWQDEQGVWHRDYGFAILPYYIATQYMLTDSDAHAHSQVSPGKGPHHP